MPAILHEENLYRRWKQGATHRVQSRLCRYQGTIEAGAAPAQLASLLPGKDLRRLDCFHSYLAHSRKTQAFVEALV